MMAKGTAQSEVSERFGIPAPTLLSSVGNCPPVTFSRLQCQHRGHGASKTPRPEDAYVVHIMLSAVTDMQLWLNGREATLPPIPMTGIIVGHLETEPIAVYRSAFDFLRFYVAKATIDELSDTTFGKLPQGLRRPDYGATDPVLFHLASTIAPLLAQQSHEDQLLLDQIALAFIAYLTHTYAGSPRDTREANSGRLAPWQEKRAKEYFEANLSRTISLLDAARICDLSPSHFGRAFKITTGRPPHRWLLERRVAAAKRSLATSDRPLSEIAKLCGFSDPSHFSRVFSKTTGETPAAWRRSNRSAR